jgi:hypothetical protein
MKDEHAMEKPVQQWCERHWKPIADSYNEGDFNPHHINGAMAQIYLMTTIFGDEEMQQRAGFSEHHKNQADPSIINVLMAEIAPICCWIGDEGMAKLYEDCRNDRPIEDCPKCKVKIFPGGYNRKTKQTIFLHHGGAWDCEQYREIQRQKGKSST